jgi:ferrous iron transport protein A
MVKKLAEMSVGDRGRVTGFAKGVETYRKKLISMGLVKGTEFLVNRLAPMGDPVEIEVRGYNLSLRKEEASVLHVEGL